MVTEKSKRNKRAKRFIYQTEQMLKKPEKRDCPKCKGHKTIAVKTTNWYRRDRRECPMCKGTGLRHPTLTRDIEEQRWREAQWKMIQEEDRLVMQEVEEAMKEARREDE